MTTLLCFVLFILLLSIFIVQLSECAWLRWLCVVKLSVVSGDGAVHGGVNITHVSLFDVCSVFMILYCIVLYCIVCFVVVVIVKIYLQ